MTEPQQRSAGGTSISWGEDGGQFFWTGAEEDVGQGQESGKVDSEGHREPLWAFGSQMGQLGNAIDPLATELHNEDRIKGSLFISTSKKHLLIAYSMPGCSSEQDRLALQMSLVRMGNGSSYNLIIP